MVDASSKSNACASFESFPFAQTPNCHSNLLQGQSPIRPSVQTFLTLPGYMQLSETGQEWVGDRDGQEVA